MKREEVLIKCIFCKANFRTKVFLEKHIMEKHVIRKDNLQKLGVKGAENLASLRRVTTPVFSREFLSINK